MLNTEGIVVSICCITYNHEKFIVQAIEGFLMQRTNFPFEIIIHDDASTDKTAEIIRGYENKFPEVFKPIYQTENQWSKGIKPSPTYVWPESRGKYIALCEGDDYWTDKNKLQKQVDFLEANEDYAICFHEANYLFEDGKEAFYNNIKHDTTFDFLDLTQRNFISTASCVFRVYDHHRSMPGWFSKLNAGDWGLNLLNASRGKIYFLKDCMSVYRIHKGGMWNSLTSQEMCFKGIEIMDQLNEAFEFKYNEYFEKGKRQRLINFNQAPLPTVISKESFRVKLKRKIKSLIKNS